MIIEHAITGHHCNSFTLENAGSSGNTLENLFQVAEEVGKAVGSLVNIMTDDEDSPFEEDAVSKDKKC